MRFVIIPLAILACSALLAKQAVAANADTNSPTAILSADFNRAVMKRVADWQLVNPSASSNRYTEDAWTWGALYTGMMAWSRIADDAKYHKAMLAMGKRFDWKPAKRIYDADDHCVTQTYLELFLQHRDPAMLKPTQERFDYIPPVSASITSSRIRRPTALISKAKTRAIAGPGVIHYSWDHPRGPDCIRPPETSVISIS